VSASTTPAPSFSFHRGSLALDFAGTVGARASVQPEERLPDVAALGQWLREAGLLAPEQRARPSADECARAVDMREAIARIGNALFAGSSPHAKDIATINDAAVRLALGTPLLSDDLTACWMTQQPVSFALGRIAADAIAVFSAERARLTRCALPGCGALLLSRARNEPRRWCSMETCGNRAKVAAHRARKSAT
jgi:predicted RNA-binding Zn ribbon-like protein